MIEYIYIVKCPDCEDEHFHFFDDAKTCARSCMSQKPVITQVEVNRNDFGECTDHSDLGTVWSWEDECEPEVEPTTFSKADIKTAYDPDNDPEFQDDDFFAINSEELDEGVSFKNKEDQKEFFKLCSETGMNTAADLNRFMKDYDADDSNILDKLRAYKDEIDSWDLEECSERKPIPEGMTIEQLVETMQENEDMIECAGCEELFPKDECFHKEGIGWVCGNCEDSIVKCTWCEELYDKSVCRYEVDLGWLCSRCEAAIKSRGETLTFREGPLDEAAESKPIEGSVDVMMDGSVLVWFKDRKLPNGEYWELEATHDNLGDCLVDFVTDQDVKDLTQGRFNSTDEIYEYSRGRSPREEGTWTRFIDDNFNELIERHGNEQDFLAAVKSWTEDDYNEACENFDWDAYYEGQHEDREWQRAKDEKFEAEHPELFN